MNRPGVLFGVGQTIEVGEDVAVAASQREIELPPRAELEQIKRHTPPDEEPLVVGDERLEAWVAHVIEPVIKFRPKMPDGAYELLTEFQDRPRRRWRS
jgi:hypothetical protein